MADLEAGFFKRRNAREYLDMIVVTNRLQEFSIQIDDRKTCKPEAAAQFSFATACRVLKQDDATPVEIFDEPRMEDDAGRVAVPPFHCEVAPTYLEVALTNSGTASN